LARSIRSWVAGRIIGGGEALIPGGDLLASVFEAPFLKHIIRKFQRTDEGFEGGVRAQPRRGEAIRRAVYSRTREKLLKKMPGTQLCVSHAVGRSRDKRWGGATQVGGWIRGM